MNRTLWARFFLISPAAIILVLMGFFGVEFLMFLVLRNLFRYMDWRYLAREIHDIQRPLLLFAIGAYGAWRIWRAHPAFNNRYREWLATTPWTATTALPAGPITLVWQDVLLIALAAPLAAHAELPIVILLAAFCIGYAAMATGALLFTRRFGAAYALAMGFAALVRAHENPIYFVPMAVLLSVIASVALHHSLRFFPWPSSQWAPPGNRPAAPFDRLGQLSASARFSIFQAVRIGLLVAAWSYVMVWKESTPYDPGDLYRAIRMFGIGLAIWRFVAYVVDGYAPPISFFGRVATGRLIIPGFDKILLAPACIVLIAWQLPMLLSHLGWSQPALCGATAGTAVAAALGLGPALNEWRLTGSHRIILNMKIAEPNRSRPLT